jgi:hypothetical protein
MPKKKSIRAGADRFIKWVGELESYYEELLDAGLSARALTWSSEAAVIKLHVYFEHMMLHALVAAINNDTSTVEATTGVRLPRHLTDEVCEYFVTGGKYFDFRGRSGLIDLLKRFVPPDHFVVETIKRPKYRQALDRLTTLRNFAAHESTIGKKAMKRAVDPSLGSAGVWLKREDNFLALTGPLKELAGELAEKAPN